jgi:hypothetical protein
MDGQLLASTEPDDGGFVRFDGANLSGADLRGRDLHHPRIARGEIVDHHGNHKPGIAGWRLDGADLSGVDLSLAVFTGANLTGAKFAGALLNWWPHYLIAEILRLAAGPDVDKLSYAAFHIENRGGAGVILSSMITR